MCERNTELHATVSLAVALGVLSMVAGPRFVIGEPIKLWETSNGWTWTFSYHQADKPDEPIYHWRSSLIYFDHEFLAKEAMVNFVASLNHGWERTNAQDT